MTVTIGYTTDDDFIAFALARGVTVTAPNAAIALTKALDYMETRQYKGYKTDNDQVLDWPRQYVYIDNVLLDSATVPSGIVKAQHVIALSIANGYDPLATIERAVKREKVDVLEVEYQPNASATPILRSINAALSDYVASATSVMRSL
ncbi:MAG TPA: hypothetical protein PKC11_09250 [Agitococcus sp.]|nr:hypothetical protein [Agitococcus sp.]HMX99950.1 hypothetical protein [Agitococcus sp.]HNC01935.1 hypothetical protein [Agitococcus sp.]HNH45304.1 hypothetical protein [Agitococcus sp.]HNJ86941.1 hypothetical protein [Agitococcus sp.]